MNADWMASVRSLLALAKADGWHRTLHGKGFWLERVWQLEDWQVHVDADGLRVLERGGSLPLDWQLRLNAVPRSVQEATDYLAALDIVPVYMSSGYGIGAVDAIDAAKEAMAQGLAPRLETAIREEISAAGR